MKHLKTFVTYISESTGDLEDSFIDIDIDETDLEVSEEPEGELKQNPGKIIIETPSKTDAYNMKKTYGGDEIVDPKYSDDKQILHIKDIK
jgi:hypothetical protein